MKRHLWKLVRKTRADRLGPGLITGAADDDPSGIATYSQAGAQFGFGMLWTVVFTFPLMTAIQMVSARIGHVTHHGLSANIKLAYPRWVTLSIVLLLLGANTLNVSADIAAMGEALHLLAGGVASIYTVTFGLLCLVLQVFLPYQSYVRWLKWLTLSLLSYVAVVFMLHVDWAKVAWSVIVPPMPLSRQSLVMIVALFGTTISPYLFFWQAAQEMEDVRALKSGPLSAREVRRHLRRIQWDTTVGMAVSNIIAFFIILATAVTLHAHGSEPIETAAQAAEALRPLAGEFTFALFSMGIIGTGLLAVPVLAGSAAYAAAEAMGFEGSLSARLEQGEGKGFYSIIALSTLVGVGLNLLFPHRAVQELFWSAVLNGVIAVPIMVVTMLLAGRHDIMGEHTVNGRLRTLGWISTAVMGAAVVGMLWME
jgi:NRAMP (natural resistance-associated macrophage protein)-like metal ion transporter